MVVEVITEGLHVRDVFVTTLRSEVAREENFYLVSSEESDI